MTLVAPLHIWLVIPYETDVKTYAKGDYRGKLQRKIANIHFYLNKVAIMEKNHRSSFAF